MIACPAGASRHFLGNGLVVLKPREKIFLAAAILIGLAMVFDTFITRPKDRELAALRAQVLESDEKLMMLSTSMTGFQAIKKRVEEKRKQKEFFAGRIADFRQIDLFLDQIGQESQRKQIGLTQLTINYPHSENLPTEKGKPSSGNFGRVVLEVGLMAGYEAIGPYLDSLQALPIFLEVEKVDISRKEGVFPKLQVTIQQSLYWSKTLSKGEPGKAHGKGIQPVS